MTAMNSVTSADEKPVGVLITVEGETGFRLSCFDCAKPNETTKVFPVNLSQYRGTCVRCEKVVHAGHEGWPELYNGK